MDIHNQVLLKTPTFKTKTILKYCSKTSSIGTKLIAKMVSVVSHSKVITHSLFTRRPPSTSGTELLPPLAAQYTLPHPSTALLPPEVMLCSPLFSCYSTDAPRYTSVHSILGTLLLVTAVPECSIHNYCLLWPPSCWKQFSSCSDFLFLMIKVGFFLILSPRRSPVWGLYSATACVNMATITSATGSPAQ